ncbi:MAG TPA: hypothetical protein PKD05_12485, partial [Candidatus Melainabacteria bacterium]|nr:hypothetical protein [Candidatus Melainabacteria bacterium]
MNDYVDSRLSHFFMAGLLISLVIATGILATGAGSRTRLAAGSGLLGRAAIAFAGESGQLK